MNESEFIALVDCRFPYRSSRAWRRLSAQAVRVSSNAPACSGVSYSGAYFWSEIAAIQGGLPHAQGCLISRAVQRLDALLFQCRRQLWGAGSHLQPSGVEVACGIVVAPHPSASLSMACHRNPATACRKSSAQALRSRPWACSGVPKCTWATRPSVLRVRHRLVSRDSSPT